MSPSCTSASSTTQIATFYVGDLMLGVPIDQVEEINRHVEVTTVPHAPPSIRGVINLRGNVVTVVDLRSVLRQETGKITSETRNVVIQSQDGLVGLLVDRITDILLIPTSEIGPPPANVRGIASRFFHGVHALESEILVFLDVEQVLEDCQ